MKEIVLFAPSSSVTDTVQALGELGVVDIREIESRTGASTALIQEKIDLVERSIGMLDDYQDTTKGDYTYEDDFPRATSFLADRILLAVKCKEQVQNKLEELHQEKQWYETWGRNTNTGDLDFLREKGIYVYLYLVDQAFLERIPSEYCVVPFPEKNGKIPIALFTREASEKLPIKEVALPMLSWEAIQEQIERKKRQLAQVAIYLKAQAVHRDMLVDHSAALQEEWQSQQVLEGMGNIEGKIKYLKGYLPKETVTAFKEQAAQTNWGYQIREPKDPAEVPVHIKNPKWISIINPVMKFIDIVPGYKELDVSIYFLVAFALFFAMLVGDAGYGIVFLLFAFLFRKKIDRQVRTLIYVLSGATMIWGILSGTYFGAEQIAALPFLNQLVIEEIASFGVDNVSFMMKLSFLIGAIHLTVAHTIRFFQFINSIKALSEIGWIALVWGLFFVANTLVLSNPSPPWSNWLFIGGATLVVLFSQEGKNLKQSILFSLSNLPLSLINGFSDIVSYVRLFAVGMATAAVASSFNNMILPNGLEGGFLGLLMAAVALLLGHGLNIILALMAVMVHGIRLNMLEFSGHLGVQFSGEAYQPFKLTKRSTKNKMGAE